MTDKKAVAENKFCFFIAPIGEADSDPRKRSDQILKHVVGPAARECGYEAIRADKISEPGIITTQVIQHIIDDAVVVADLTGRNPNVFYELAIRHALRKPYVQIIQKGEKIPFDIAAIRTVDVDYKDLDSVEEARIEIAKQIRSFQRPGAQVDSPISVAVDLEVLRQSGNPEQRQLADVLAAVTDLRAGITLMDKRLTEPTTLLPPGYLRDVVVSDLRPMFGELFDLTRRNRIPLSMARDVMFLTERLTSMWDTPSGDMKALIEKSRNMLRELQHIVQLLMEESGMSPRAMEEILVSATRHSSKKVATAG